MPCTCMHRRALDCPTGSVAFGGKCTGVDPTVPAPAEKRGKERVWPGERVPAGVIDSSVSATLHNASYRHVMQGALRSAKREGGLYQSGRFLSVAVNLRYLAGQKIRIPDAIRASTFRQCITSIC
jgi:hypothetical protein